MERLTQQELDELMVTLRLRVEEMERRSLILSDGTYSTLKQWCDERAAIARSTYDKLMAWPFEPMAQGDKPKDPTPGEPEPPHPGPVGPPPHVVAS